MGKLLTAEADAMIEEAVEATLREHPDADVIRDCLRAYLRKRWPYIVKAAIRMKHLHDGA